MPARAPPSPLARASASLASSSGHAASPGQTHSESPGTTQNPDSRPRAQDPGPKTICERHDAHLPEPLPPPGPRLHHPAQPLPDGLDARRPGRGRGRLRAHGGVLRRARARRRRAHRHRRHRTQRRGPAVERWRHADHPGRSRAPPRDHRRGAPRGRQDRHADPALRPLRLSPRARRTEPDPGAGSGRERKARRSEIAPEQELQRDIGGDGAKRDDHRRGRVAARLEARDL